jgi:hypothetical protein
LITVLGLNAQVEAVQGQPATQSEMSKDEQRPMLLIEYELPRVANNQLRPSQVSPMTGPDPENPDPGEGGGGGGWTYGACNCKRVCVSGGTGCSLGTNNQCKALVGGACESCVNPDCGE